MGKKSRASTEERRDVSGKRDQRENESSGLRGSGRLDGRSVLEGVRPPSSGGASVEGAHVSRADQSEGDTCVCIMLHLSFDLL